jgi:predicted CoA-substrate-specific enzyme activase
VVSAAGERLKTVRAKIRALGLSEKDIEDAIAAGIARLVPGAAQVIDVGGHGTRVIRLGAGGAVKDFAVSGQCAAGSARILEVIAHLLGLDLAELGEVSLRSTSPAQFVVGCAVFAETEAISLLTRGTSREDLLAGLHQSLAARILAMARAGEAPGPWAVTGGGAKDAGLVARLRTAALLAGAARAG